MEVDNEIAKGIKKLLLADIGVLVVIIVANGFLTPILVGLGLSNLAMHLRIAYNKIRLDRTPDEAKLRVLDESTELLNVNKYVLHLMGIGLACQFLRPLFW